MQDGIIECETFGDTYPFAPNYRHVNGFNMHFVDEGEGDPIVLLHGDPTWGYLWRNFIPVLSERARCIVPDHMGMGKSEVPRQPYPYRLAHHVANLEALLIGLNLRQITLVVHDWGGPVGLGFAIRQPDRIKRLVITNSWASARWPGRTIPSTHRDDSLFRRREVCSRKERIPRTGFDRNHPSRRAANRPGDGCLSSAVPHAGIACSDVVLVTRYSSD